MTIAKHYFVTGTDTDVGKTCVSSALLYAAREAGLKTAALKPIAAGCCQTPQGLRNDDALALQALCTQPLSYRQINPVALEPAIAPHIAAQQAAVSLSVEGLARDCRDALDCGADFTIIEGAGGWRVPLNDEEYLSGLACEIAAPVILVVGMRLGCLNHALLSAEAIRGDGLQVAAWVANRVTMDMPVYEENINTLSQLLAAPLLGSIPYLDDLSPASIAHYIDMRILS